MKLERTTSGLVIHSPRDYDFRLWVRTRGRERAFRDTLVELARLTAGESVLDVGCATGSLAIAAKRRVGEAGRVHGVDPSPAMVARARKKAARARLEVTFDDATAQELPFPDRRFDAVTSTLVFHQLPHDAYRACLDEMRRVLKPGGRLLLVDIGMDDAGSRRSTPHSHGHFDLDRIVPLVADAGLEVVDRGAVVFPLAWFDSLRYVLAIA